MTRRLSGSQRAHIQGHRLKKSLVIKRSRYITASAEWVLVLSPRMLKGQIRAATAIEKSMVIIDFECS